MYSRSPQSRTTDRGANIGAAGDNAQASNFVQQTAATPLAIGAATVDRFALVAELMRLRAAIATTWDKEAEAADMQEALAAAEAAARAGTALRR